jgi:hypothetical protein
MSTEAKEIFRIRHQGTASEDTTDREELVCAVGNCRLCELAAKL